MNPTNPLHFMFLRFLEGEGAGAGGGTDGGTAGDTGNGGGKPSGQGGKSSLFSPEPGGEAGSGEAAPEGGDGGEGQATVPDWIAEKYRNTENPIEAQAKAYSEAVKKLSTKTEDLRSEIATEVREEVRAEVLKEIEAEKGAIPEGPEGYEYPEGWEAPGEELDKSFKEWAHKHRIPQEAFNELVNMYGQTLPDPVAEREKLGPNVEKRVAAMNNWGGKNIPESLHAAAQEVMQTAEGFELIEHFMRMSLDNNYSPEREGQPAAKLTAEMLTKMQGDPRYYDPTKRDPAWVKQVDEGWQKLAASGALG